MTQEEFEAIRARYAELVEGASSLEPTTQAAIDRTAQQMKRMFGDDIPTLIADVDRLRAENVTLLTWNLYAKMLLKDIAAYKPTLLMREGGRTAIAPCPYCRKHEWHVNSCPIEQIRALLAQEALAYDGHDGYACPVCGGRAVDVDFNAQPHNACPCPCHVKDQ